MNREQFLERVKGLRQAGKSIRAIAAELGVHRSRVQRALQSLTAGPASLDPSQSSPSRSASAGFVGRRHEMERLMTTLEDALTGQTRLVMVSGEPGIGKTRVAQELSDHATNRGAPALWGRCYQMMRTPPYWPWVQVIRAYSQSHPPEQLRAALGVGAPDLVEIVPDLRKILPDLRPPPVLDPEQSRFRLFDSIIAFLNNAAATRPLALIFDNLHWADQASLLLLEFLAQEKRGVPLFVLGTYREEELSLDHPLANTLGELTKEQVFQRLPLSGLSLEDVGTLIKIVGEVNPAPSLVCDVYSQTEGNPLFVTEVTRLLAQEGRLADATARDQQSISRVEDPQGYGGNLSLPDGIREAIGRRLSRLSEDCNRVLTVGSVIGREFWIRPLERIIPTLPRERLLQALEEGLTAGIIEEAPGMAGHFRFSHVLVQETLARELSATRRAGLHGDIGEALEDLYGASVEAHAAELAYHFSEAQSVTGSQKFVRYCLLAGERALATYAHEQALSHFQVALAAKEGQAMDAESAALLFGLGRAQAATRGRFQFQEYLSNLGRAFDYYAEAGDVDRAVAVAEYPVRAAFGVAVGASELISRAQTLAPPESRQAGALLSTYGLILYQETGDYQSAQAALAQAGALAQREVDPALEARTWANSTGVSFHHLRLRECLETGQRALDLARRVEDPHSELVALLYTARALNYLGGRESAQGRTANALLTAEKLRDREWLSQILWVTGSLSHYRGDYEQARDFLDRSLAVTPDDPRVICTRTVLEYEVGDSEQGETYSEWLLDRTRRYDMGAAVG